MRFLFLALVIIAGILGAVVLVQKGQARIAAETAPETKADVKAAEPAKLPTPATPPPMETLPKNPVTATASAQTAPTQTGSASETPGLAAKPASKKPPEPPAPAYQVLAKPAVTGAGILETTRGRVILKDIVGVDPTALCGADTSAWPCGQLALTQFRRFLRGRSVNCDIADPNWQGDVTARCTLGKEDLAAWLVENGWARPVTGSQYEEAGRAAEAGKRGIFASDPRHP